MKHALLVLAGIVVLAIVIVLGGMFYVVDETQQVVLTQFGRPVGQAVTTPGLKLKVPFIQKANFLDKRYLAWDGSPNQFPTKEKVYIYVDTFARWRIANPLQFLQRVQNEVTAQSRLDGILDGATRDTVARQNLIEVVRSSNREFAPSETGQVPQVERVELGREQLAQEVAVAARASAEELGIEILDVRFKRIKYREDVEAKVFDRMKSERKRIAEQFRAEGAGEAARIRGERERDLKEISSDAYRQAQEIAGRADAEAAEIYAGVYTRDPEFYRFTKSMEVLGGALDDTTLLLGTGGELLRYLGSSK